METQPLHYQRRSPMICKLALEDCLLYVENHHENYEEQMVPAKQAYYEIEIYKHFDCNNTLDGIQWMLIGQF